MRGALSYRNAWLVTANYEYVVQNYQAHDFTSIEPYLPPKGLGLSAKFGMVPDSIEQAESFLSFKFVGKSMSEGSMPLSVFKDLVDNISALVRSALLPKALQEGRNIRFFDVTIGQPKFASLLVSIKGFDFDSQGLREFKNTKHLEPELLRREATDLGSDLWKSIEETSALAEKGGLELEQARLHSTFLDQIAQLLPSSDNDLERLEISYRGGVRPQVVAIDQAAGDRLIQAGQLSGIDRKSIIGTVIEINGEARTFIVKNVAQRQTTIAPKWRVFEALEQNDALRRGVVMRITGLHWKRTRRDYMVTDDYPEIVEPKAT